MHNTEKNTKFRRIKVAILSALLIASVTTAALVPAIAGTTSSVSAESADQLQQEINQLEAEQSALEKQQAETAEELSKLQSQKDTQLARKQKLDEEMTAIAKQMEVINNKIKKLNAKITSLKKEMDEHQEEIDKTYEQLKARIRALYLAGEASDLELILNAHSIADLGEKLTVVQSISEHDNNIIQELKTALEKIKVQKEEYQQAREQVSTEKSKLEEKQSELQVLVEENEAIMAEINSNIDAKNSLASQLESEFNSTSNQISEKIKAYNASKSASQQQAEAAAGQNVVTVDDDNYDPSYTPSTDDSGDSGNSGGGSSTGNGQFIWPTPGATIITSGVGPRWGAQHNGIDISGGDCYGTPILASDSGTVTVANHEGWGGGYGLYVVIDHGNGYSTLYGHQSNVIVNEGQTVSQGQTIGYIGSTGDSTGPHLHFEIRANGSIVDPESYVGSGG